jgi:hypothetical protein
MKGELIPVIAFKFILFSSGKIFHEIESADPLAAIISKQINSGPSISKFLLNNFLLVF